MESRVLRVADDTPSVWLPSSSKLVSRSSLAKRSELPTHTCSNPVGEPASSVSHLSSQQRQPLFLINHFQLQVTLWLFFPSLSLCCDERCSQGGSQATKVCLEVSMALLWMYLKFLHMITCYFKRFHAPCGYVECRFFLKKNSAAFVKAVFDACYLATVYSFWAWPLMLSPWLVHYSHAEDQSICHHYPLAEPQDCVWKEPSSLTCLMLSPLFSVLNYQLPSLVPCKLNWKV